MNAEELLGYAVDLTQAAEDQDGFVAEDNLGQVHFRIARSRLWVTDGRGRDAPDTVAADSQRAIRAALRPTRPTHRLAGELLTSLGRLHYAVEGRPVPVHLTRPPLNAKVELTATAPLKIGGQVHERLRMMLFQNGDAPRLMVPAHDWTSLGCNTPGVLEAEAWTLSQLLTPLMFTAELTEKALRIQAGQAAREAASQWHAAWDVVCRCKAAVEAHRAQGAIAVGARAVVSAQEIREMR